MSITYANDTALSYAHGASDVPLSYETIGQAFDRAVAAHASRTALVSRHQKIRWTYREFQEQVDAMAAGLVALGLEPGERIGIWSPNCAEWAVIQYATAKAGLVRKGQPDITSDFSLGGLASAGGRPSAGGYPVKIPVIDLAEVGAGGGSIARADAGGALRVGPESIRSGASARATPTRGRAHAARRQVHVPPRAALLRARGWGESRSRPESRRRRRRERRGR